MVSNALKFTTRGEVILRVSEAERDDRHLWLHFKVSDTGVGIAEEAQQHMFEPFRHGDGSPTRKYGGTGMGLAMSKRIVELMGGKIGFSSAPNEGSIFWCTIPFMKRRAEDQSMKVVSLPWTQARVLVVDENEVTRQQLREQLSAWALASEGVSNGAAALELLQSEQQAGRPFRLVLLDIHLADMDGTAFAHAIKAAPTLASTRLVVLTETPLDSATADSLGFAATIAKPPNSETLHGCLTRLIEAKHSERRSAA